MIKKFDSFYQSVSGLSLTRTDVKVRDKREAGNLFQVILLVPFQ